MSSALMAAHVGVGVAALVLGPLAAAAGGARAWRAAYASAVLAVIATAVALVARDPGRTAWLLAPAALALGCLAVAWRARHPRLRMHGWGGTYIALVTATLVVSVGGALQPVAWVLPTVVGLVLIELRFAGSHR